MRAALGAAYADITCRHCRQPRGECRCPDAWAIRDWLCAGYQLCDCGVWVHPTDRLHECGV